MLTALLEGRDHPDPASLLDEISTVLDRRLDREDRGVLLMAAAAAAHPDDLAPRQLTHDERRRAASIPDFDDPDFLAKLHTDAAPLDDRKRLFVRIWESFDQPTRREFVLRVDPRGEFCRRAG